MGFYIDRARLNAPVLTPEQLSLCVVLSYIRVYTLGYFSFMIK